MQKLAGIITEEQLNEVQSSYSVELLVPKVYFNVETGELSGNKYEWYSERELRAGADQTSYTDAEELDTVVFSNDYSTAMDFASEYPELLKVVSLNESQLNEDILELKQMSKQLYSFLKSKGFRPELRSKIETDKTKKIGEGDQAVQIIVTDQPDERVLVAITAESVAKVMVGGGNDWSYKAAEKFGQNITSSAISAKGNWFNNPEIKKYVDNLGNEILKQIFEKYPNMIYGFSQQDGFWYILTFKFKETAKGGTVK
jgi:hypothetical protein